MMVGFIIHCACGDNPNVRTSPSLSHSMTKNIPQFL